MSMHERRDNGFTRCIDAPETSSAIAHTDAPAWAVPLADAEFAFIVKCAHEHAGIWLSDKRRDLARNRLGRRLRALGLASFADYCALLASGDAAELAKFANALTTNVTSFFREAHHFEYLEKTVLPKLIDSPNSTKRLRIWSAGCSSGEEPYSIAMLLKALPELESWDAKILATDIDTDILQRAEAGIYSNSQVELIPHEYRKRWVHPYATQEHQHKMEVDKGVRDLVRFRKLNLTAMWPMRGKFDVIFCRNVAIYFDPATQHSLFSRFADTLFDGGYLFVGHAENLFSLRERFSSVDRTTYRKLS